MRTLSWLFLVRNPSSSKDTWVLIWAGEIRVISSPAGRCSVDLNLALSRDLDLLLGFHSSIARGLARAGLADFSNDPKPGLELLGEHHCLTHRR